MPNYLKTSDTDAVIYDRIKTLASGRVYVDHAPVNVTFPCVVFRLLSSSDWNTSQLQFAEYTYLVEGISRVQSEARELADNIQAALHYQTAANTLYIQREQAFSSSESLDGVLHYRRGGLYKVLVSVLFN